MNDNLKDIRQDIFDIEIVPKVLYVYRGDTFELDLDLTISSSELNTVVLNCDGLPEATPLILLESTADSSKWRLVLNKMQTLILAPKTYNFTITIVRTDGTELTLYKGIMAVNNRVHSNYSNNYYVAALLKQTAPTIADNDYLIGTMWVNVLTNRVYFLTSVVNNEAKWLDYAGLLDERDIRMDEMAYFNYAGRIYGDKYSLLPNAWESSLAVDPSVISANSWAINPMGTAQYPNGETEGVIIPQGVATIGNNAFYDWKTNNQPLVIPNSVTTIAFNAFYGWEANNQPLVIPNSVTTIGNNAFENWKTNNQPLVIPNSVTSIGNFAFENWESNNQPLVIPDSVTSIGIYAFHNWQANNQPLVIPDSVTSIVERAFWNWVSNNQPLVIPSSVEYIGTYAFNGWSIVPYIEIQATTPPTLTNANAFAGQNDAPIYVPDESVDDYTTAPNWSDLADRIFPISDKNNNYTKSEIDTMIGNIDAILDSILGV